MTFIPPYSVDRRSRLLRLARKFARVVLAFVGLYLFAAVVYSASVYYLQRRCMEFKATEDSIAWTTDPKLVMHLAADKNFIVGQQLAQRRADSTWRRYTRLRFGSGMYENSPMFLGVLQNRVGEKRLVAIYPDGGGGVTRIIERPRFFYLNPIETILLGWADLGPVPDFKWVTYFQGATDASDSSRFTIPYDSDTDPGKLKGRLRDDGMIDVEWDPHCPNPEFAK